MYVLIVFKSKQQTAYKQNSVSANKTFLFRVKIS